MIPSSGFVRLVKESESSLVCVALGFPGPEFYIYNHPLRSMDTPNPLMHLCQGQSDSCACVYSVCVRRKYVVI